MPLLRLAWWGSPPPPCKLRAAQIKAKLSMAEGLGAFPQGRLVSPWPAHKGPNPQIFFFLIPAKEVMD